MKNHRIFIAFVIFLILLITIFTLLRYYSGRVNIRKDSFYEISIRIKGSYETADSLKNLLSPRAESQTVIEMVSKNLYDLVFGKFPNAYKAGEAAFNLFADKVIPNYKITLDGKEYTDYFSEILYVAREEGRASLFSFDLQSRKSSLVWSDWGEEVVSLKQSPNRAAAYFLTVESVGTKGSLSSLNEARLYHFKRDIDKIKMVDYLHSGIQFYSYWNDNDRFMTSFLSLDSASNQNLFQNIAVFDSLGGKIEGKKKTINLVQEGFPNPPVRKINFTSTMNKYIVYSNRKEKATEFFIKRTYTEEGHFLFSTAGQLHEIAWSPDDKYLFFIYSDIVQKTKKTSKIERFLAVFDADTKKIIRKFDPDDFSAISVYAPILAIETGKGAESAIIFYNYVQDKIYHKLQLTDGCAIKNLPLAK